jgi:hypothetical protein
VKLNRDIAKILGPERAALLEPLVDKKFFRTLALGKLYEVANAQVCSRLRGHDIQMTPPFHCERMAPLLNVSIWLMCGLVFLSPVTVGRR